MFSLFKKRDKYANHYYEYNSAQILGERDYQAECFYVTSQGQSLFAIITDGIKDAKIGRSVALFAIESFKDMYYSGLYKKIPAQRFFEQAVAKTTKALADNGLEQNRRPAITALIIEAGFLYVAEVHDNIHGGAVYLCKDNKLQVVRKTKKISSVVVSRIKLVGDEVLLLASDGVTKSLSEMAILHSLSDKHHPNKCQNLKNLILKKHIREQENATLIVTELTL